MNPDDTQRLLRIVNTPKRGIGATSLQRLQAHAASVGETLWQTLREADEVPGLSPAAVNGLLAFARVIEGLQATLSRPAGGRGRAQRASRRPGTRRPSPRRRRSSPRAGWRTSRSSPASPPSTTSAADEPSLDVFLQEISLYSDTDTLADTQRRCSR